MVWSGLKIRPSDEGKRVSADLVVCPIEVHPCIYLRLKEIDEAEKTARGRVRSYPVEYQSYEGQDNDGFYRNE